MQNGMPKHVCAIQIGTTELFRLRSGKMVNVPMCAPPLNSRLSVTRPICSGTTSMPITATNSQSRPLNVIHENA